MEDKTETPKEEKKPLLIANVITSSKTDLSRRVDWSNTMKKWVLETPSFSPYIRSWFYGKIVAAAILNHEMANITGLVANSPDVLEKTINLIKMKVPSYDPIALVDPQSEALYYNSINAKDKKHSFAYEALSPEIARLISNRSRGETDSGILSKRNDYNFLLSLLYDPTNCAGWMDVQLRKQIKAGAKVGIPPLPFIVDNESKQRWKSSYQALKRLYPSLGEGDIENGLGIPIALHIPINREMFKEENEQLVVDIETDVSDLQPTFITLKIPFGVNLTDSKNPEQAQRVRTFLENIGRIAKAGNIPTHLFAEQLDGIRAFSLGWNTFSQPADAKEIRTGFGSDKQPTLEQRFGKIYDYGIKRPTAHSTWINQGETEKTITCDYSCCKGKTPDQIRRMSPQEFYGYAATHLFVNRNQEVTEFLEAINEGKVRAHLLTKFGYRI